MDILLIFSFLNLPCKLFVHCKPRSNLGLYFESIRFILLSYLVFCRFQSHKTVVLIIICYVVLAFLLEISRMPIIGGLLRHGREVEQIGKGNIFIVQLCRGTFPALSLFTLPLILTSILPVKTELNLLNFGKKGGIFLKNMKHVFSKT